MKVLLMYRDRDFLPPEEMSCEQRYRDHASPSQLVPLEPALRQDLELDTLLRVMAGDDSFLFEIARRALLSGLGNDADTIRYRQAILEDCLENPAVVRQLYDLTVETIEGKRKHWWGISSHFASSTLHSAVDQMQLFMSMLRTLRGLTEKQTGNFDSEGFRALFAMLERELPDEYFARIDEHLRTLRFRTGVLASASLGLGNAGTHYVLREDRDKRPSWLRRILRRGPLAYTFYLHSRDEAGAQIISGLRDRGVNLVANALAQSADHVLSFFETLRAELAFYIGCLNLHQKLTAMGSPTCFPKPQPAGTRRFCCTEMYDIGLALTMGRRITGNTVDGDGRSLVIVTGANQGGKSSFLRSVGLAQLMLQAGMFVGAESFTAELCVGLFTHYKREEDATMTGGKLDEELERMSIIAEAIRPQSLVLFNESFASTNEREGSEIARQVVTALLERHIRVFFVTHLYDFAHGFFERSGRDTLCLRAGRRPDGTRTFKLAVAEPLDTSYGEDLYQAIFAAEAKEETVP